MKPVINFCCGYHNGHGIMKWSFVVVFKKGLIQTTHSSTYWPLDLFDGICFVSYDKFHMISTLSRGRMPYHDDVIKWKHFPRYWPLVRGLQRSPVNSPHKGQRRGALMFFLICALNKLVIWDAIAPIMTSLQCKMLRYQYRVLCA